MDILSYRLKGQPITINVVESVGDLPQFQDFIRHNPVLGFDTETTGLDWWNADRGFRLRLAQFGNAVESYVIPAELREEYREAIRWALRQAHRLICHGANHDLHVSEACLGIPMETLAPKTIDTKIVAHLVDPRSVKERGPGLKLEELTHHYIDPVVAEEVKGSMVTIARRYKTTKKKIWAIVALFDPEYNLYAGMDPILAYRLFHLLWPKVPARTKRHNLFSWEHQLAHIMGKVERTGYLLDVEYAQARSAELLAEETRWKEVAKSFGVDNIGSNPQLIDAFTGLGVPLTKKTPEGQWSMDDSVLSAIGNPLAEAVTKARKAQKWRSTWFDRALNGRDSTNRVHASINSLKARTARMSITGAIPAQTFPAGDGYVRGMWLADEDELSGSIDYANMELRFLAAESGDPTMKAAFRQGKDLHQITADAAGVTRKIGKMADFLTVFGGGWKTLAEQAEIDEETARRTLRAFRETYPRVEVLSKRLMQEAKRTGHIYTVTGRRLPVDRNRPYAALNYAIQSGSRDITANAAIELDKAGFTPYIRLPIHDEFMFSFPREDAEEMAREAARIMTFEVKGVTVPADAEIGERSWGSILDRSDSKH